MKQNGKGQIVFLKSVSSMMKTKKNRMPTIISQYGIEGIYASSMDKLQEMKAEKQVKTTMVRIYPEVVDKSAGKGQLIQDFYCKIDPKLTAEMIVSGIKNGKEDFAAPYSAIFVESIIGMLPVIVSLRVRKMLYHS